MSHRFFLKFRISRYRDFGTSRRKSSYDEKSIFFIIIRTLHVSNSRPPDVSNSVIFYLTRNTKSLIFYRKSRDLSKNQFFERKHYTSFVVLSSFKKSSVKCPRFFSALNLAALNCLDCPRGMDKLCHCSPTKILPRKTICPT